MSNPTFSTDVSPKGCPIPTTHKRLLETHELWHQAANNYSNPDLFRTYLNASIQALRNITFVLQSEKHAFDAFEAWYSPWQTRMKASSVLVWAKDARTRVVKQADLDTVSTATVRLLTWKDDELIRVPVDPATSSAAIVDHLPIVELIASATDPKCDLSSAVLEVERQWNLPDLNDSEVLDALAAAYGLLSDLVVDAHTQLRKLECIDNTVPHPSFRAVHHRSGAIPCMTETSEFRKERFSLSTGNPLVVDAVRQTTTVAAAARVATRYGMSIDDRPKLLRGADPDAVAKNLVYWSKKMLRRDRYHIRVVFVRDGAGDWHPMGFAPSARSEKHVAIRLLAQCVRKTGADAIIDVGEIWLTELKREKETQNYDVDDLSSRGEALQVVVATRNHLLRLYITPFSRGVFGGIKLQDTRVSDEHPAALHYLYPVFKVWADQGTRVGPDGKRRLWLWEPDPLDRCYCGASGRFGACCDPILRRHSMEELPELAHKALSRCDLDDAERFAQAAVAQYAIWMRQHTVQTRHVASDLHRNLVAVDVPAMEAHVRQLDHVLEVSGRGAELVARLRRIGEAVRVPEVRVRLIAIAAERLYEIGTRAEAAAELDRIDNFDAVTDATALRVAAGVFDRDHEECCRLLKRAMECADNERDRCAIELDLANEYRRRNRIEKAVKVVDGVIGRTQGKEDLAVARTAALDLRWRISGSDSDFRNARRELEGCEDLYMERRLLAMLVDHGDLEDAEALLSDRVTKGDAVAQMLRIEILLDTNRTEQAVESVRELPVDRMAGRLRSRYGYTMGVVALRAGDAGLAATAAGVLRCIDTEEGGLVGEWAKMLDALDRVRVK